MIKDLAQDFIEQHYHDHKRFPKELDIIPDYYKQLALKNYDYKNFNHVKVKTTDKFTNYVYDCLKNSVRSLERKVKNGKYHVQTQEVD